MFASEKSLQPIDRAVLSALFVLSLTIAILIGTEKACDNNCWFFHGPRVSSFSWQDRQLGVEDTSFILTFDRPMDRTSVEQNLIIEPSLSGKVSWSGQRLAYTLNKPIPYGIKYRLKLIGAKEKYFSTQKPGREIEPFVADFQSRDRVFAYIGTQGQELGRLIIYNSIKKIHTVLTPPDLVVTNFKFYPQGEAILFFAVPPNLGDESLKELQLYRVSTKIPTEAETGNSVKLVLDNKEYQNNRFDLSPDGKTIVVQRVNRQEPKDFGLWMIRDNQPPQRIENSSGGDFLIAPDSQTLAVSQGEGISLIALEEGSQTFDFLPKFSQVLSFTRDGRGAAMVNFNTDNAKLRYTRSLFYVNNQGLQKELLNTKGSIIDCQFNPQATHLYCLLTEVQQEPEFTEQPYLAAIDLETAKLVPPLVQLPRDRDIKIAMAPDGLAILFDRIVTSPTTSTSVPLRTSSNETIVGGKLWLLSLPDLQTSNGMSPQLKELQFVGFYPEWSP
jgi:hypothetical protein